MRALRKISPITFVALGLAVFAGCKEFYDSEFEEAAVTQNTDDTENRRYEVDLVATDVNFPDLTGKGDFDIQDGVLNVDINLDEIPQNFTQVSYTYSSADCSSLQTTFAANTDSTRNFTHSETLTNDALAQELIAAGASQGADDTDLANTSLLIRAAPIANGLPSPSGTNMITIACGIITLIEDNNGTTTGTTTGQTTSGTTGDTTGSDTVGTVGGTDSGDIGTTTGGDFGGGVGGEISGSVGGDTAGSSF